MAVFYYLNYSYCYYFYHKKEKIIELKLLSTHSQSVVNESSKESKKYTKIKEILHWQEKN